jgi:hypothetical protein
MVAGGKRIPGWYADPDEPSRLRYWDGEIWTEHRRNSLAEIGSFVPPPSQASAWGRLSDRGMKVARKVTDAATDPARLRKAVVVARPALDAALDGARVRNKKGQVRLWRVARAAARPRRTMHDVGRGVTAASASQIVEAAAREPRADVLGPTDQDIISEWTLGDPEVALLRWREGCAVFDAAGEDPKELRASALLMCELLKHCLIGKPIVDDDDAIIDTAGDTLVGALNGASEGDWNDEDQRIVRLALAVARRFGVQSEELGGNGELGPIFEDIHDRMRMAMSVAPSKWSCDLSTWFADPRNGLGLGSSGVRSSGT